MEIKTLSIDQLKKAFDLKIEYLDDDPLAQFTAQYQDEKYYFCCGGCKSRFEKDPEKYSKIAEEEASHH